MSVLSDDRTTEEFIADRDESTTIETVTDDTMSTHSAGEQAEAQEFEWIQTPLVNRRFVIKHPRVLLSFLRFIDEFNELADPDEIQLLPAIPQRIVQLILSHPSLVNPPPEFLDTIREFRLRLERHMDLSELPQQ